MTPICPDEKAVATAQAEAALAGILCTPSRDERGRRTVILRRGVWVREALIENFRAALEEAKHQEAAPA